MTIKCTTTLRWTTPEEMKTFIFNKIIIIILALALWKWPIWNFFFNWTLLRQRLCRDKSHMPNWKTIAVGSYINFMFTSSSSRLWHWSIVLAKVGWVGAPPKKSNVWDFIKTMSMGLFIVIISWSIRDFVTWNNLINL